MEQTQQPDSQSEVQGKEALSPLPFTYERTFEEDKADYNDWLVSPVVFVGEEPKTQTEEEIVKNVERQHKEKEWYTSDYWREKGMPSEQVEFTINSKQITVYNSIFMSRDEHER